jgi:hypothetical protein
MYEIKFTERSKLELERVSLTVADLRILHPVTVTGLPETISPELRCVLEGLVCSSITPLRVGWLLETKPSSRLKGGF